MYLKGRGGGIMVVDCSSLKASEGGEGLRESMEIGIVGDGHFLLCLGPGPN